MPCNFKKCKQVLLGKCGIVLNCEVEPTVCLYIDDAVCTCKHDTHNLNRNVKCVAFTYMRMCAEKHEFKLKTKTKQKKQNSTI